MFVCILRIFPQEVISERLDAYGYYYSGLYSESVKVFKQIESGSKSLDPNDRLILGISEFKTGNFGDALNNFQTSEASGIALANLWIAKINAVNKNTKDALLYIERYLNTSKSPDLEMVKKDSLFKYFQDTKQWFDLMQNDWSSENQNIIKDAEYYAHNNDFGKAHKIIETRILKTDNKNELYAYNSLIYNLEGNPRMALDAIDQALISDPENNTYLKRKAGYLQQLENYSSAITELNNVIEKNPVDFDARFARARAELLDGKNDLARKDINIYVKYFNSEDALFLAGQIYYASEKYTDALKYYNRLMQNSKPDSRYFKARGMTYYQSGTYKQAAYDLSMSLDLIPGDPETNLYKGLAEYYKGNNSSACYYWKRAHDFGELKALEYIQKYCK